MDEITTFTKELRLPGMENCWRSLIETRSVDGMSLRDGLQLLLSAESEQRKENRNARLLKTANFRYQATIMETQFDASRGLDKNRVMELATCAYIKGGIPVIITGPAGTGKSWLATVLGHQACMMGFKVRYYNIFKLFEQIAMARMEGTLTRFFNKIADTDLLIIDDFGVRSLDKQQMLDFLELMEDRHAMKSTIIVSQLPVANWYDMMKSNSTAADAILDRIVHTAQRFELKGESLRKK
jgi:DNA replication protein DnaC